MVEWESVLREAGERVQEVRDRLVESNRGSERLGEGAGGDVTIRVDEDAEKAILDVIRETGRDVRIVTEERGELGERGAEWTLVIDPIDGSGNYERQIPFYCTSIAVLRGRALEDATHALVRNLVNGDVYYSEAGSTPTKNGATIKASDVTELAKAVVGVDISRTTEGVVRSVTELIASVRRQVHFGANALELCLMAEGRIDGFVDVRGRMRVMDIAAACLICRQAGASFSDELGGTLSPRISVRERFSMVGAANAELHAKLVASLRPSARSEPGPHRT